MENYKPTKEDLILAKSINDSIIVTQTLSPSMTKLAFLKLFGYNAENTQHARRAVASFFIYTFKPEMITDYAEKCITGNNDVTKPLSADNQSLGSIGTMENKAKQSHQESVNDDMGTEASVLKTDAPRRRGPNKPKE